MIKQICVLAACILWCAGTGIAAPTATLNFNYPDGVARIRTVVRTIRTATKETRDAAEMVVHRSVARIDIQRTPFETRVTQVTTEQSSTRNGEVLDNPVQTFRVGKPETFVFSPAAELLRIEGNEHFLEEAKAVLPESTYPLLERGLGGNGGFYIEKRLWGFASKRFFGKTFTNETVWKEVVVVPDTETDQNPAIEHTINAVRGVTDRGEKKFVGFLSVEATTPEDLALLEGKLLTEENCKRFLDQPPISLFSHRIICFHIFEANTGLPFKEERTWRHWKKEPEGLAVITETRLETYQKPN